MNAESAVLQDEQPSAPTGRPEALTLPLFRPGTQVIYQGQTCTVHYVTVRRSQLMVNLRETDTPVDSEKLQVAPTRIPLPRR